MPALEALGRTLREARLEVGLTQRELARRAELSAGHLGNLEAGTRRTRESTLARLAAALVKAEPKLGTADALTAGWVEVAGRALAPESQYRERVERRRARRWRKKRNRAEAEAERQRLAAEARERWRQRLAANEAKRRLYFRLRAKYMAEGLGRGARRAALG